VASPQCENGYTRIANELLEQIISRRIPGQELRVVLFILRKTYGFSKKSDQISYGQIGKAMGIPRTRAIMHVKNLVSKKILGSLNNGTRQPLTMWINKDYSQWKDSPIKGTSPKEGTRVVPYMGTVPSPNYGTHKRKIKETIQKKRTYCAKWDSHFELFWEAFNDKRGKKPAYEKSWKKIPDMTEELAYKIIEGAKRYAKNRNGSDTTPKMAQGWLSDRRWEDEIESLEKEKNLFPF
jgi:phage replication O-like protein O